MATKSPRTQRAPRAPRALTPVRPAAEASVPAVSAPPSDEVSRIAGDQARLSALRESLAAQRDAIESDHAAKAASSPLALRLEVVGCQLAQVAWPDMGNGSDARNIPEFRWPETPCPFGKSVPDQDCRQCVHHTIMPLGGELPAHTRRYPHAGTVIPLTEEQSQLLTQYLAALGAPALRRVDAEIAAVERAIAGAEVAQRHAQARALEAHQSGRAG